MTAAQLAEHTALRRGAVTGKPARPAERGPLLDDPWAIQPAPPLPVPPPRPAPARVPAEGVSLVMSLSAEFDSRADRRAYAARGGRGRRAVVLPRPRVLPALHGHRRARRSRR